MTTHITSPIEGFEGRSTFGPLTLDFKDGVAETEEQVPDGIRTYLLRKGYTVGNRAKAPTDEAFDPSKHNVDDVNAYLAELDPEGEEYARVVQAERDGKARKSVLEAVDAAEAGRAAAAEAAEAAEAAGAGGDGQ